MKSPPAGGVNLYGFGTLTGIEVKVITSNNMKKDDGFPLWTPYKITLKNHERQKQSKSCLPVPSANGRHGRMTGARWIVPWADSETRRQFITASHVS